MNFVILEQFYLQKDCKTIEFVHTPYSVCSTIDSMLWKVAILSNKPILMHYLKIVFYLDSISLYPMSFLCSRISHRVRCYAYFSCFSWTLLVGKVSQGSLIFEDFNSFGEHWSSICRMSLIWNWYAVFLVISLGL